MSSTLSAIIVLIALLGVFILVQQLVLKRAVVSVIRIFRRFNATDDEHSKSIEELGLQIPSLSQRLFALRRDFKPNVLQMLVRQGIVVIKEDGTLYLSEARLADSPLKNI